ncbi:MAG: sulfite exporter TauE/SafE family protein [Candidatus Obscuribacterales bacterium]|nr:sulfite exporter TauE/SafE family protein [Candidatus Obscuribacterales bacterium]
MDAFRTFGIAIALLVTALLYAVVGHAGASGYLAVLALFSVPNESMKPIALTLNILVSSIVSFRFIRSGNFSLKVFWPLALSSVPFAFLGGAITLPFTGYRIAVALVLLFASYRLLSGAALNEQQLKDSSIWGSLLIGAILGLISGLTGTGGGIFLSPVLIFLGWANTRTTSGISAAFILVNSISGLAGNFSRLHYLPPEIPIWLLAVAVGGIVGSELGIKRLSPRLLQKLLGIVLIVAALKLILTR